MDTTRPDAGQTFLGALRTLHHEAGIPSSRAIAERTGGTVSHAAVHHALTGRSRPTWSTAQEIIKALGGDPKAYLDLWRTASRSPMSRPPAADSSGLVADSSGLVAALTATTAALDRLTAALEQLPATAPAAAPGYPQPSGTR